MLKFWEWIFHNQLTQVKELTNATFGINLKQERVNIQQNFLKKTGVIKDVYKNGQIQPKY
jgi:hypothetical protein